MKKRRYFIHETNFRDKNGNQLDAEVEDNVIIETDNLSLYGKNFWLDGGRHKLGDDVTVDKELNIDCAPIKLKDGSCHEGGMMDVFYMSYDLA
jgi:hypothetical protein